MSSDNVWFYAATVEFDAAKDDFFTKTLFDSGGFFGGRHFRSASHSRSVIIGIFGSFLRISIQVETILDERDSF